MPTLSKKQLRCGAYRVEADVSLSTHQIIKGLPLQLGVSNIGEAIDYLTKDALNNGFEASFVSANNLDSISSSQLILCYEGVLNRLSIKYELDPLRQSVLLEVINGVNAEQEIPCDRKLFLVDVVVSKETHDFFKRMRTMFGHKASKAKLLSSLITFSQ